MENLNEKMEQLSEYMNHSGQQDLAEVVLYLKTVLVPHCERIERLMEMTVDACYKAETEFDDSYREYKELTGEPGAEKTYFL